MSLPVITVFIVSAFALGWWTGQRRLESKLNKLSGGLKKSTDSLADALKKQQP